MKKIVVVVLALVMAFSLAGCFKIKTEPKKPQKPKTESVAKVKQQEEKEIKYSESKWGKLQKTYMDTGELFFRGMMKDDEYIWAAKGGITYHNYKNENGEIEDIISNSTTQWWVYKDKTYETHTFSEEEVNKQADTLEKFYGWFMIPLEKMDEVTVKVGEKEYKGKTYEFEEISYQGEKDTFLYDDDGNLVIDIFESGGETFVYEDIQIKTEVEDSLFQVPDDYRPL